MQRKLTIIFVLITLCMASIIYSQASWMYNSYNITLKQLTTDVNDSLHRALQKSWNKEYTDSLPQALVKEFESEKYAVRVDASGRSSDTLNIYFTRKISAKETGTFTKANKKVRMAKGEFRTNIANIKIRIGGTGSGSETSDERDSLLNNIQKALNGDKDLFPREWGNMTSFRNSEQKSLKTEIEADHYVLTKQELAQDSVKLTSIFKEELKKMNINSPFYIWIYRQWPTDEYIKAHALSGSYFDPTSVFELTCHHHLIHYGLHIPDLHVGGFVFNPARAVLMKMSQILFISAFLIAFTIFCFIYLFRVILKQKRLAEMKDDFINNMTHEFQTPIATVLAAIEGMQKFDVLDNRQQTEQYLETSRKEMNRLNNLVIKVLNMARHEKREIELAIKELNVDELVNEIITAEKLNTAKAIKFIFNNPDKITLIKADPVHFRNALANLVDNAKKYSGKKVEIQISCYKDEDFVYFSVRDNGLGIPAGHIKKIFDKFHRVPTGNIHNVKGTGLGLSYVKYVIEAHGGTVSVKSELGKGSEFIVSLPIG